LGVASRVGNNATSSTQSYDYNGGGTIVKPSFNIINIIPESDYEELALANGVDPKTVTLETISSNSSSGLTSAELMITYTYTSEVAGYLSNIRLFAGQQSTNGNSRSETLSTANSVMPELDSKTILAGSLETTYLLSDSDGSVRNAEFIFDSNLATSSPSCSNVYNSHPDSTNAYIQYYKDVKSALNTTNNQTYSACYTNDGAGDASAGAKVNGVLIYTYSYYNPPVIAINSNNQYKSDGASIIPNGNYSDGNIVLEAAAMLDSTSTEQNVGYYFELLEDESSFGTATTVPSNACSSGVSYGSCSSKIWSATGTFYSWYDDNWNYRKVLTVNASQVVSNETDFTILATTTDSDLADIAHGGYVASSTGADIVITDSSGTTTVPYERVSYDSTTGEIVLWIKADISSTTNTSLYIYYGNSNIDRDYASTTLAWSNNYSGVWHLDESPSSGGTHYDATSNDNDGSLVDDNDSSNTSVEGIVGGADDLDGDADYINIDTVADDISGDYTMSSWINLPPVYGGTNFSSLVGNNSSSGGNQVIFFMGTNSDDHYNEITVYDTSAWEAYSGFAVADNTWHYITYTRSGSTGRLYVDGIERDSHTANYTFATDDLWSIGAEYDSGPTASDYLNGTVDEVWLSNTARSAGWIKSSYSNQTDTASFISFGSQVDRDDVEFGRVSINSISENSSGYKWQVIACQDNVCSDWDDFNPLTPNFVVDATLPITPGPLTVSSKNSTSVTLGFGTQSSDINFTEYKIFYKEGSSGVLETDIEHDDFDLDYIDYNGTSNTTITGLEPGTEYVVNIWAYDEAGNKASASELNFSTNDAGRARTVMFVAGNYSGDGTSGQLSDTEYTFDEFNFSLAETDVAISNAYIIFEAQFEAYTDGSSNYNGYELAFDSCQKPCTVDAFSGLNNILTQDDTVLAYNESESNQIRILQDVTDEAQLAAYTGNGKEMAVQIGYNIKRGSSTPSISGVRAKLVVTYSFDDSSPSITNTVIYPLDSSSSNDLGSRQSSQGDDCTKNSDCPVFLYNMDIPEYSSSLSPRKISQWFQTYGVNDSNNGNDIYINANIEGTDIDSATYVHESALSGTQGNFPMLIFSSLDGYSENTNQSFEYHPYCPDSGAVYYLLGGEVYETYIASSSVAQKTRTVSFPIGVLNNGLSSASSSGAIDVYFPENGLSEGDNITIKKAWFRVISNNYNTGANTVDIVTKVGDNATSSDYTYNYDVGGSVIKPSFNIIHIIPESDYEEMAKANAVDPKTITIETKNSNSADQGGTSVELMITYAYSSEAEGYLSNISLFAGQSYENSNSQNATSSGILSILPEKNETKTILAGALLSSHLNTDSDGSVSNSTLSIDANLGTSLPTCSNAFVSRADSTNSFTEFYKDISSALTVSNNQSYYSCYSNSGGGDTSGGAKMNGQLIYTYQYYSPQVVSAEARNQYKSDAFTSIVNGSWTDENEVYLSATAGDTSTSTKIDFYFELVSNNDSLNTSSDIPTNTCLSGSTFNSCSSKIWTVSASTTAAWYDNDWAYRKKITINSGLVEANENDFPVLASTTDSVLAHVSSGGHMASSTGGDILVTDSSGTTLLPFEREYYNPTNGELALWIKTDISSTTNKDVYIYYGNSTIVNDYSTTTGVWNSDYVGVYHLKESPADGGIFYDSTSYANDGSFVDANANTDTDAEGIIDGAVDFNGDDDYINIDGIADDVSSNFTVSGWVNLPSSYTGSTYGTFVGVNSSGGDNKVMFFIGDSGSDADNKMAVYDTNAWDAYSTSIVADNSWHYLTYTRSGNTGTIYIDGDSEATHTTDYSFASTDLWAIATEYDSGPTASDFLDGRTDEVRISKTNRSANWIKTTYNNQKNTENFASFSASEESSDAVNYEGLVNITSIPDSAIGYKWQVKSCNENDDCSIWDIFDIAPNFKVDANPPTAPGNLTLATSTATSITLNFGSTSSDANFSLYKIFYKEGLADVDTDDFEHSDSNLLDINYNGVATTTIFGLEASTKYIINIWAYDLAGNKTSATELVVITNSAPHSRGKTVIFHAGDYVGDGTSGQNSDTDQTFPTFNFRMLETGLNIRNAYIIFEATFESYADNSGDYTGYDLVFDACAEPCIANAFSGTGNIMKSDSTVLAYDETESNQVRLILDVTDELSLDSYSGDNELLEGQVGYNIKRGTAVDSISSARAKLVITYAYNGEDSGSYTNTVIYPLESGDSGDSGTRRSSQASACTKNSDCPEFDYNMEIPDFGARLDQWFNIDIVNDGNGSNDVILNLNIQTVDVDSNTYVFESALGGTQGEMQEVPFQGIYGFSENSNQSLEVYQEASTAYLMGGEVFETYAASSSSEIKTRTVSFPLGIITNGQDTTTASGSVQVYFPENGGASGIVDIKKAWFRIKGNDYNSGAYTVTASTKIGDNSQSGNYIYNLDAGGTVVNPVFNIIHVVPSSDYSELELANANSSKEVILYTTNSSSNIGGISAELMITYTYTSEESGYLSSLDIYGGQSYFDASVNLATTTEMKIVLPELKGSKTIRAGTLLSSYLISDSDHSMPGGWFSLGSNISTTEPSCTNSYYHRPDSLNSFAEFYKDVYANLGTTDEESYIICISNSPSDTSAGAKMNSILKYTYQWETDPPEFTANDWRWYENIDSLQPTTALANDKTQITGINIGEALRIRMNIGVSKENLSANSQSFKLQYGLGSDCSAISSWTDLGGLTGAEDWIGYNNPDPADGDNITANLLASSTVRATYEESNSTDSNPYPVSIGEYAEWDWVIYDNNATSTSEYCFRMVKANGDVLDDYLSTSYPKLKTAPANTAPNDSFDLSQWKSDEVTEISNSGWIDESEVRLVASANDINVDETITLYFELLNSADSFTIATTEPSGACTYGTSFGSCSSKIWFSAASASGDFRDDPYIGTTSVTAIPESSAGYKWQVLACDSDGACSSWVSLGGNPNFRVDLTDPTPPGSLSFAQVNATGVVLTFGATTTEANFSSYKIFYKVGSSSVAESDIEHSDSNMDYIDYNSATSTVLDSLSAGTTYVFNIWAYDQVGHSTSSIAEISTTTLSSYTPPTGGIFTATQKTDGSGIIDMVVYADDPDNDDTIRIKMEYVEGSDCDFTTPLDPSLDETDENITAVYGDPDIDDESEYQIGTSTGWIITSPGENYVVYDWQSMLDIPTADTDYCIRTTVNDGMFDQDTSDTQVVTIDNVVPTTPGALTLAQKDYDSIRLSFGSASADTHFDQYRIFYKQGTSTVSEDDTEHSDSNLSAANYSGATSTVITGLRPNTSYVFNIWAYDTLGNKASSTEISIKTNSVPTNIEAKNQYKGDGISNISNGEWTDDNDVVLSAAAHDKDVSDTINFYYEVIDNASSFTTETSVPSGACSSVIDYSSCSSNIWTVSTTTSTLPNDWYSRDWLYRKKITINSSQALIDDNNFAVLINITDSDLATKARSDAYDILFTDDSGTTTIPYEREDFDSSTGDFSAWLGSGVSSSGDIIVYMYYGNAEEDEDNSTEVGVWDSSYQGVWHLDENVVDESTENNVHLDTINSNNANQFGNNESPGIIANGQEFDGNDYINIPDSNDLDIGDAITLSAWMNIVSASEWKYSRRISLSPSTPEDNYQIELTLTSSSFDYSKLDSNGDDLRFYDSSDNLLDYFIETWNTSGTSTVWVEVKNSGTSFITMKYGNDSAPALSNATSTFVFYDDFSGNYKTISDYTIDDQGTSNSPSSWSMDTTNQWLVNDSNIYNGPYGSVALTGLNIDNYEIRISTNEQDDDPIGVLFSYQNANEWYGYHYTRTYGGGGSTGEFRWLGKDNDNVDTYLARDGNIPGQTTTVDLIIRKYSQNIEVYEDDVQVFSVTDSDYAGGDIGLFTDADNGGRFPGPFIVRKYSTNDPVLTIGEEGTSGIVKEDAYGLLMGTATSTAFINSNELDTGISSGWNLITMTYDRSASAPQQKIYINGILTATSTYSAIINTNSSDVILGSSMSGYIDELEISSVARSADYIKTIYNNQKNPDTFITLDSESRVTSYFETSLVLDIPDAGGYKWQVMACDDDGDCSSWDGFGTSTPNFKIDTTAPTAPGALSSNDKTSTSITLSYGAQTTEANFSEYRIFYSTTTPVYETDIEIDNTDLDYIDYNGSSITTLSGLTPDTDYYFNIWAYDEVGHKASSTVSLISTNPAVSSPGAIFYTKNTQTLYYKVWDGSSWGSEQTGPTFGSASGDNIRHIRTLRSDDGGRIAILVKTWDGSNQEWWASIYRFVADDFVDTTQLGAAYGSATNAQIMSACMASISGGEFFVVKSDNGSDGTRIYTWDVDDGWAYDNAGPNPLAVMNACTLVRRPGTDNYLLVTHDDDSDIGTSYYIGGANYSDSWTTWTQHSGAEEDNDNFAADAFFDPNSNTRGAISYSDSNSNWYGQAKFFVCDNDSINYGSADNMPTAWTDDFVHGEFASDPNGAGVAYYAGRDIDNRLSVLKLDISSDNISWSEITDGTDIASTNLYSHTNDSQKPFDITFYRSGEGVVAWNSSSADTPYYRYFKTSDDSVDSSNTAIPGAPSDLWVRTRIVNDPNEEEFISVYQNDNIDYAAVFFDGASDKFYNTVDNPASNQVWTTILSGSGAFDRDDEAVSFSYASYNSPPNTPSTLTQYKTDASTTIANLSWTNESTIKLETKVNDPDTEEIIKVYLELLPVSGTFTSTSSEPIDTCASTTSYTACSSKIWAVATSTAGDYSLVPFIATATIGSIPDSDSGYKWQVIACDDEVECSSWKVFNINTPNFKVDTDVPDAFSGLSISSHDSKSVTLSYGTATVDSNFSEYRIFYKAAGSGVLESDIEHDDTDLDYIDYNGQSETTVLNLASSTQYVFNIWAYDEAGNKISGTEVSTTTSAGPNIEQSSYVWENDKGGTVNSNTTEEAVDTALSGIYIGERLNARIQIENNGGDVQEDTIYKLQFENQTDNPGVWLDVGADTEISYSSALSGVNGDLISASVAALNSNDWNFGTFQEETNLTSVYSLDSAYYTEFVFTIETSNALLNKTYRLRLYNETESKNLNAYSSYPELSTAVSESIRYSKETSSSLKSVVEDLTYYLDPTGYSDVSSDDSSRDSIETSNAYPVYLFATKHTNDTDAIDVSWNGRTNVGGENKTIYLQVYEYGSPNQWVTVASNSSISTSTEFTLTAKINSSVSLYYDSSNWTYWRVYQESDSQTFETDYYDISFSAPVPEDTQIHYRWREDDDSETAATWRESEDDGDPSGSTDNLEKGTNIRLRIEVANTGGGIASNYNYQIEYASTTGNCTSDPGNWETVKTDESGHWNMSTSTNFSDGDSTTAQLFNNESYSFVTGGMVEYTSTSTGNISLGEDDYTELEYVIRATNNAITAGTYCFRVTNSGVDLDSYDIFPVLTLAGNTNTAPYFTVEPSDNGSASTSPTSYGTNVSFTATAQDDDVGDDYYLAICKTNAITAGNDGPPSCTSGDWCISELASSTAEADCDYTTAESDEEIEWYAFACDRHAGYSIAKCSSVSQGTGASDASPFAINHPPVLTSVTTSNDNQDPGSTFNITTETSDDDTFGGVDSMDMYICRGTSAAYGIGCAGGSSDTICSVIATTTSNISCSYDDTAPTPAGTNDYHVFLFDGHGLAADNNYIDGSYTINNVPPVLGSLVLNGGADITLNLAGAPDIQVQTINTSIVDVNGCDTGLVSAVATIYMSGASGEYNCTGNNSDCYQINTANCVKSDCTGDEDTTAIYTCTTNMKSFAVPTDASTGNPWESHNWLSYLNVYDGANYSATTSSGVELITNTALEVTEGLIDFGSDLAVGENTGSDDATTTVVNIGNSPIDASLSGTDMSGNPSGTITVDNMEYSLEEGFTWSNGSDLSTSEAAVDISAPNPVSSSVVADQIYWGIGIPYGSDASIYYGLNNFSVSLDNNDWQSY